MISIFNNIIFVETEITHNPDKILADIEDNLTRGYEGKVLMDGTCLSTEILNKDNIFTVVHNGKYNSTVDVKHTIIKYKPGYILPCILKKIRKTELTQNYIFQVYVPDIGKVINNLKIKNDYNNKKFELIENSNKIIVPQQMITDIQYSLLRTLEINDVICLKIVISSGGEKNKENYFVCEIASLIKGINFKLKSNIELSIPSFDYQNIKNLFEDKGKKTKIKGPGIFNMYINGFNEAEETEDCINFTDDEEIKEYLNQIILNWDHICAVFSLTKLNQVDYSKI